jgi:3-oxoacyl-[acyl-carrier protein] reductase
MNLQLEGKRAFVSGSSSGIGAGIARKLAQEGAIVVVHGRSEEKAHRVVNEIGRSGGQVFVALGDLSTNEGAVSTTKQSLINGPRVEHK